LDSITLSNPSFLLFSMMLSKLFGALFAFASSQEVPFDDVEGLSLLQLRASVQQETTDPKPFVDKQGRCCTADFTQGNKDKVLGPAEGVEFPGHPDLTIWFLSGKRKFRKMVLVNEHGEKLEYGYLQNLNSNSETPDPRWENPKRWKRGPRYGLANFNCGECVEDAADAVGDPHMTTNTGKHFDYHEKELIQTDADSEDVCYNPGGVTGEWIYAPLKFDTQEEAEDDCSSMRGCRGIFEDQGMWKCIGDGGPGSRAITTALAKGECNDDAAAVADPHMTTNTGEHFDYQIKQQ